MYETPAATTPLFRATTLDINWQKLLTGHGAYYTTGGRYNRTHQTTVYAADDPIVAISELGYYEAKRWQAIIGKELRAGELSLPLIVERRLWCFTLKDALQILDLTHETSREVFGFCPFILLNPSQSYGATQELADLVRNHPTAANPAARGIKAPSVRTIVGPGVPTFQTVLFVRGKVLRAEKIGRCKLTFEFLDQDGNPVDKKSKSIDWCKPRFQLRSEGINLPLNSAADGGPIPWDDWIGLPINYV